LARNSLKNGVKLGTRPMIDCEIQLNNKSTRSVFMYWNSIKDMLSAHKSPDLIHYYPTLINNIRIKRTSILKKALEIRKKREIKAAKKILLSNIVLQNQLSKSSKPFEFEYRITTDI
jgi:hypothetical protein